MKTALISRALVGSVFALLCTGFAWGQTLAFHQLSTDSGVRTAVVVLHPGPEALLVLGQSHSSSIWPPQGEVMLRKWNEETNLWSIDQLEPRGGLLGVADRDGDGHDDILVAGRKMHLYSGATAQFLGESDEPGYPFWLGDLDGDRFDEFFDVSAHSIRSTVNLEASPITLPHYAFPIPPSHSYGEFTDVAAVSDLDGDGIREVVVGYGNCSMAGHGGCVNAFIHNRAVVYSGADGTPLILAEGPNGYSHLSAFGWGVVELDDLDADGRPEVLITNRTVPPDFTPLHYYVYSGDSYSAGATPLLMDVTMPFPIWTVVYPPLLIGDVNADGFKDLAFCYLLRFPEFDQTPYEYQAWARFLDGRSLDVLWEIPLPPGPSNLYSRPLGEFLAMGDVNSDSFPDFATFNFAYGTVWVYSGAPTGTRILGDGQRGMQGTTPRISVQRPPRVGETSSRFNATDVSAGAIAVLLLAHERNVQAVAPGVNVLRSSRHLVTSTATVAGRVQATTTVDFSNGFRPGDRLFAQWAFLEPTPTGQHLATSPILEVVVQD